MAISMTGEGIPLRSGDLIAYGDAVGWTVVWSIALQVFNVWHNLELIEVFPSTDTDMASAMETAQTWIMANTFE